MYYLNTTLGKNLNLTRYDIQKFIEPSLDFMDFITSYFIAKIPTLRLGNTTIVQGEGGRPDLLSFRIYRSTQYWWILLVYNNIYDIMNLVEGMVINYPDQTDLETLYFTLTPSSVGNTP